MRTPLMIGTVISRPRTFTGIQRLNLTLHKAVMSGMSGVRIDIKDAPKMITVTSFIPMQGEPPVLGE